MCWSGGGGGGGGGGADALGPAKDRGFVWVIDVGKSGWGRW
jgi:hypothetical protein